MGLLQCTLCLSSLSLISQPFNLCQPCYDDIRSLQNNFGCLACATPDIDGHCGDCLKKAPAFDRIIASYIYEPPLDSLIIKFKYQRQWHLAQTLATLMPPLPTCDLILPVPLHKERLKERGFNQAHELLKKMSLSSNPNILNRCKNTPPQAAIQDRKKRYANIRNCFELNQSVKNKSILIFDDVMTSGATLNEIALTLKKGGATHVIAACIARASH